MFETIRNHQRILQFLLLLLILPAFVFFGLSGYQRFMSDDGALATVGTEKVTRPEFDEALRRQTDNMRQMFGGQVDPRMLDTPEMRNEVLDGLINQKLLALAATEHQLSVSDTQLRDTLSAIPALQKPDGTFDIDKYRQLLSAQGMNEAGFEAQMRRDLAMQLIPEGISQSSFVPKAVIQQLGTITEQVREVSELKFDPKDYVAKVTPTEEQLKKFYDDNPGRFENPESAKVELVQLTSDALASQVAIKPEDVRAYYDQNKTKYTSEEERKASHILIKAEKSATPEARAAAKKKAEELLAQVRKAPDQFAAVAKANSQDPGSAEQGGDLGLFRREDMVGPFANAAFSMKPGDISDLVETEFGYHIIKLTEIKAAVQKSFDEVRADIESDLKKQEATKRFAEAADTFSNKIEDQSDTVKPAADALKLPVQVIDGVSRDGAPNTAPNAPINNPKLLSALFTPDMIKNKRNTTPIELAPGSLVAARIVDYKPPVRKPFAEVSAEIRTIVVDAEARKLAIAAGKARLADIVAGKADATNGFGSAVLQVSRATPGSLPPPVVDAVMRTNVTKLPAYTGADLSGQGYAVLRIDKVLPGANDSASKQRADALSQQIGRAASQQDLSAYVEELRAKTTVKKFPERLAGNPNSGN